MWYIYISNYELLSWVQACFHRHIRRQLSPFCIIEINCFISLRLSRIRHLCLFLTAQLSLLHKRANETLRAYTVKYWVRGVDEIQIDGELMEHNEPRCLRQSAILSLYCTTYVYHTRDAYKGCFVGQDRKTDWWLSILSQMRCCTSRKLRTDYWNQKFKPQLFSQVWHNCFLTAATRLMLFKMLLS